MRRNTIILVSLLALVSGLVCIQIHLWSRANAPKNAPANALEKTLANVGDEHDQREQKVVDPAAGDTVETPLAEKVEPVSVAAVQSLPPINHSRQKGAETFRKLRSTKGLFQEPIAAEMMPLFVDFLQMPADGSIGLGSYNSLKNEVLDYLIARKATEPGLGDLIVRMYRDKSMDPMWRDYCVQHFAQYYEARWPDGLPSPNDPDARRVRDAFWEAVSETDSTISGSALIGMERLSRRYPEMERETIANMVVSLAMTDTCPPATRTTALQLCGVMGRKDILPVAQRLAQREVAATVRIASIHLLGELGGVGEALLLRELAEESHDQYIRAAAATALESVKARQVGKSLGSDS